MNKCIECGRDLKEGITVDVATTERGVTVVIVNVPCEKCDCGEEYYNFEITERLDKIIDTLNLENTMFKVIVVDFDGKLIYTN